jgi:SAM-dependent methyltransferase
MRYIDNPDDLETALHKADELFKVSDDAAREFLASFSLSPPKNLPGDPYSPEYYDAQMRFYLMISGRERYSIENEHSPFDLEEAVRNPFPYATRSTLTVGEQLIGQGFLIRFLSLPPGAEIVEFGPGWGHTTLHLAQMGHRVTAVEVEQRFLDLIQRRAQRLMVSDRLRLVKQDMLSFSPEVRYDAALFFESFHHCSNHLAMLKKLKYIVKEEGIAVFAAEPIVDRPDPWGVRLDGLAVWSTRKYGWLELGFDNSYFLRTLLLLGWTPRRYRLDFSRMTDMIVARRSRGSYRPSEINLPPDEEATWAPYREGQDGDTRFAAAQSILSCERELEVTALRLQVRNPAPLPLGVTVKAGRSAQTFMIPEGAESHPCTLPVEGWQGKVTLESQTWRAPDQRELGIGVSLVQLISQGESMPKTVPDSTKKTNPPPLHTGQEANLERLEGQPPSSWEVRRQPGRGLLRRIRTWLAWRLFGPELRQINEVFARLGQILNHLKNQRRW